MMGNAINTLVKYFERSDNDVSKRQGHVCLPKGHFIISIFNLKERGFDKSNVRRFRFGALHGNHFYSRLQILQAFQTPLHLGLFR